MSLQKRLKGFLSDTVIYGVGNMFSRAFGFLLIPLYTGYLDKAQYANLILLQLIFAVLSSFQVLTNGVFFYYYEYKREKIKKMVFASWLAYEVVLSVLIFVLSYFSYPLISPIFALSENTQQNGETFLVPFLLMILQLFPFLIYNTYYNLLRINFKSKGAVSLTIIDAVLVIIFVLYFLAFAEMGVTGIILGQLIAKTVLGLGILLTGFYEYLNPNLFSWAMIKRILAFSYPFFLSSSFMWIMSSSDKIMGTQLLDSQAEVAYLGLAMQVTIPITLLVGIVSQSYAPYVMSIRHEANANKTYLEVLSLVVYVSGVLSVIILSVSPFLVDLLADETYYPALQVIPLFALSGVISIIMAQLSLGLNLTKQNIYIAIGTIAGGVVGFLFNLYLQPWMGIRAAGYSQIMAFTVSTLIIYKYGRKFMPINYEFKWILGIMFIMTVGIILLALSDLQYAQNPHIAYLLIGILILLTLGKIGEDKYQLTKLIAGFFKKGDKPSN